MNRGRRIAGHDVDGNAAISARPLAMRAELGRLYHVLVIPGPAGQMQVKWSVVCGNWPSERGVSVSRRICIVLPCTAQCALASFIVAALRLPSDAAGPLSSRDTIYWLLPVEITPVVDAQPPKNINSQIFCIFICCFLLMPSKTSSRVRAWDAHFAQIGIAMQPHVEVVVPGSTSKTFVQQIQDGFTLG